MPYSFLEAHYRQLGRLCKANKKHVWQRIDWAAVAGTLTALFLGAAIGGGVGLFPFFATHPSNRNRIEYFVVIGASLFVAVICACWRMSVKGEGVASARNIYDDFGVALGAYEEALQLASEKAKP